MQNGQIPADSLSRATNDRESFIAWDMLHVGRALLPQSVTGNQSTALPGTRNGSGVEMARNNSEGNSGQNVESGGRESENGTVAMTRNSQQAIATDTTHRATSSREEIFGQQSRLSQSILIETHQTPIHDQIHEVKHQPWQTSIILLAVIAYYIYVILSYGESVVLAFRSVGSLKKTISAYNSQSNNQLSYNNHSAILSSIGYAIIAFSLIEIYRAEMSLWLVMLLSLGLGLAINYYQISAIKVMKAFVAETQGAENIGKLNLQKVSLLTIIFTPIAIGTYAALESPTVPIIALCAVLILHAVMLFKLFSISRFGKLQWIFYLCTVEILPLSLIWAAAVRF